MSEIDLYNHYQEIR